MPQKTTLCVCVLSLYTLYVSGMLGHREGDSLQLKKEKVGGALTSSISKNRLKSLFFKQLHYISSRDIYINLSMFIKQNFTIFEK